MLKAIDWKENIPSFLRFAGRSAIPRRLAWPGFFGRTARPWSVIVPALAWSMP